MDWPKAKSILILSFAGLNLFLAYHLYAAPLLPPLTPSYLSMPSESRVEEALAPYGVQAELPDRWPAQLSNLILEPMPLNFDPLVLLEAEPAHRRPVHMDGSPGMLYSTDQRTVFVADAGWVKYDNPAASRGHDPVDVPRAIEFAREFIIAHGGLPDGMKQATISYDPDAESLVVLFEQQITEVGAGNFTIFDGYIELHQTTSGVSFYHRNLWTVKSRDDSDPVSVLPVTTLLLRHLSPGGALVPLLDALAADSSTDLGRASEGNSNAQQVADRPILQAELGYMTVGPHEGGQWPGGSSHEPNQRLARPVWRISLGSEKMYFDAATGEPIH